MNHFSRICFVNILFYSLIILSPGTSAGQTEVDTGFVSGTWSKQNSPYLIQRTITIPDDSTLLIEPGVILEFQGYYSLQVQGRLLAVGSSEDSIIFTVKDTVGFSNKDDTSGGWNGIRFIDTPQENDSSKLMYCRLEFGKAVDSVWHLNAGGAMCVLQFGKVLIDHCLFINNLAGGPATEAPAGGAIHMAWSDVIIRNSTFLKNHALEGGAIQMHESSPQFAHNYFHDNSAQNGGAISIGGISHPVFDGDVFSFNSAVDNGGGLVLWQESSLIGTNIMLTDNSANWGGGIEIFSGKMEIAGGEISRNHASWGGGIGMQGGESLIEDCLFESNGADIWGGAIATDYGHLEATRCTFYNDTSGFGSGAIHADQAEVSAVDCNFKMNSATFGAALHAVYSKVDLKQCGITQNSASTGAGIHIENSDLTADGCQINNNSAAADGAALYYSVDSLIFSRPYSCNILRSQINDNSAGSLIAGLLIEQPDSVVSFIELVVDHCEFKRNIAYRLTAMRVRNLIDTKISNSIFSDNISTTHISGIQYLSSSGRITNCLFYNQDGGASLGGNKHVRLDILNCTFAGGPPDGRLCFNFRNDVKASITNCILWQNGDRQISLTTAADGGTELIVNHCDIKNGSDSIAVSDSLSKLIWGKGNISSDPVFADTAVHDYHLAENSPCIGSGINCLKLNEVWVCAPEYDLEGNMRPNPDSTMADMGVFEHSLGIPTHLADHMFRMPNKFFLADNFPNPFNPVTRIKFSVPGAARVRIEIFNILGQRVAVLLDSNLPAGQHEVVFNGEKYPSGIYICRMQAENFIQTKKMLLLK